MNFVCRFKAAIISKQDIKLDNSEIKNSNNLIIDNSDSFKLTDKSGFQNHKGNDYDIKSVYFCWLNNDDSTTEYIQKCNDNKINIISFLERNELISFLKGDIENLNLKKIDVTKEKVDISESKDINNSEKNANKIEDNKKLNETNKIISNNGESLDKNEILNSSNNKNNSKEKDKKHSIINKHNEEKIDYKESKRRKLESDPLLKCISIHEIELIDHNKALRGDQKSNDFSNLIRECEYKIVRPLKESAKLKASNVKSSSGKNTSSLSSSSSTAVAGAAARKSTTSMSLLKKSSSSSSSLVSSKSKISSIDINKSNLNDSLSSNSLSTILHKRDPIIILSPSAISMLTMSNVKSFLQDGKFIDVHNSNNSNNSINQNDNNLNMIHIIRHSKRFNKDIKFVVVNNVEKFFVKPEYWDRVVAVFTTGQEWQFKNYKINKPNLLFQKVRGFYINYNGDSVPNNVKNWNVQVISLDRNQRFKDRQISELLWESIERFMSSRGYK